MASVAARCGQAAGVQHEQLDVRGRRQLVAAVGAQGNGRDTALAG